MRCPYAMAMMQTEDNFQLTCHFNTMASTQKRDEISLSFRLFGCLSSSFFFSSYLCQNSLGLFGIRFFFTTFNMMDKMRHVYIATGISLRKVTILSGIIIKGNPNTFRTSKAANKFIET